MAGTNFVSTTLCVLFTAEKDSPLVILLRSSPLQLRVVVREALLEYPSTLLFSGRYYEGEGAITDWITERLESRGYTV